MLVLKLSLGFTYISLFFFSCRLTKAGFPAQCSWLQGTFSAPRDEAVRKVDNHSFEYFLPEGPPVKKANGIVKKNGNGKETKSKLEEYKEGLRDFQNGQIVKLGKKHVCILLNFVRNVNKIFVCRSFGCRRNLFQYYKRLPHLSHCPHITDSEVGVS